MRKLKTQKKIVNRQDDPQGGWTFIETIIVIGIIMVLTSSVGFTAVKYIDRAKAVTARNQIETLSLALEAYFFDCGQYPDDTQGLAVLWEKSSAASNPPGWNGPYLNKPVPADPWGNSYEYRIPGYSDMPFSIRSFGGDGNEGGAGNDADITSWE
jgi:general secretion pathway protein G